MLRERRDNRKPLSNRLDTPWRVQANHMGRTETKDAAGFIVKRQAVGSVESLRYKTSGSRGEAGGILQCREMKQY